MLGEKAQHVSNAPDDGAIRSVRALSTGRGFQHPEHRRGSRRPQLWWVLTSRSWVGLPISVFLIEHRDGLVLFDTGLDPAVNSDNGYIAQAIGRFLLRRIFRFDIGADDRLGTKLAAIGIDPHTVKKAVISHLHFDHIGGIADIPQADLLVSEAEWARLSQPHPERDWILKDHIDLPGARWSPIGFVPSRDPIFSDFDGIYDVMGDGSLVLLSTPGHTPGSMSLLIRSDARPPILLIGDLAYSVDGLMADRIPGTGDGPTLRQSYKKVRTLKAKIPDLLIIPSHDDAAIAVLKTVSAPEKGGD